MSQGEVIPKDLERAIDYLERAAGQGNPYAAYLAGKLLLTEEDIKDILRAIKNFEIAAENGNDYAEYQLGKLYLYGREVERDYEKAIAYLTSAAEHGNQYAEQLLHSIKNNKNWSATMGSIRLLHHLARMLQNRLEDERKDKMGGIDRKAQAEDRREETGSRSQTIIPTKGEPMSSYIHFTEEQKSKHGRPTSPRSAPAPGREAQTLRQRIRMA